MSFSMNCNFFCEINVSFFKNLQVTPAKTAELLAQFVASRTQPPSGKTVEVEEKKPENKNVKKHTPLPKATEDLTQPIMYIDKKTGVLRLVMDSCWVWFRVDMMWTCTKCDFLREMTTQFS